MTDIKTPTPGRGGARPGAGRPKKGNPPIVEAKAEADITPLEYALAVMRAPTALTSRRDRMAALAAPYCHARASDTALGKKALARDAADTAGHGTDWGGDLDTTPLN